jgi:hypothetical protein
MHRTSTNLELHAISCAGGVRHHFSIFLPCNHIRIEPVRISHIFQRFIKVELPVSILTVSIRDDGSENLAISRNVDRRIRSIDAGIKIPITGISNRIITHHIKY